MHKRRIFVLGFIGFLVGAVGVGLASVDHLGVENISPSMDLGLYLRVPMGDLEKGDIVEFPVPSWVKTLATEKCISGPILKRIEWTDGRELIVQGDHMPGRSFDSDVYGAIPVDMVTGRFVPIWTWAPSMDESAYKGGCER